MTFSDMEYGINNADLAFLKIEEKTSAKGSRYCNVSVSDGETIVEAKLWSTMEDAGISVPVVMDTYIEKQEYNNSTSYIIRGYSQTKGDYRKFLPHAPINVDDVLEYINGIVNRFDDFVLKEIVGGLLAMNEAAFTTAPAAKSIHHNYAGGLLYHTLRMLKAAVKLCDVYTDLHKDLLCAGTIIHDIGKIHEMRMDECGNVSYTLDGDLLGHSLIGIQMIDRMASELEIDKEHESLILLKHMIAAHHGKLEYGAIVRPAIPEAIVLNHLDTLDSIMWQCEKHLEPLRMGEFSDKIHGMDDARIYKAII